MRKIIPVVVVLAFVAIFGAEGALRYRDSRRANDPDPMPEQMYYAHRRLERALVRNADYYGRIHINRYGFRGPELAATKAPGTTRIMALGLSSTFCPCVGRDSATWPARLEHWLHALAPGRRFEVINAGIPGATLLDLIVRVQSEFFAFSPDVVILYAGHGVISQDNLAPGAVEHALNPESDTPDEMPTLTPWGHWLDRHSLLYHKVMVRSASVTSHQRDAIMVRKERWEEAIARGIANYRRDVRGLVLVSQGIGARVALVEATYFTGSKSAQELSESDRDLWTHALREQPELILEGYRRFAGVSRTVADSLGATFIPTMNWVTGREMYCRGNPIHHNDAGADAMARRLAEALLASKALQIRPASSD